MIAATREYTVLGPPTATLFLRRCNLRMGTHVELPPLPRTLVLNPPLTDEEFEQMCFADTVFQFERTREGRILVNPPTAGYTGDSNTEIIYQLSASPHPTRHSPSRPIPSTLKP